MNSKKSFFELIKECKRARLGKISTSKGDIDTPAFMPVGTQGTVKSVFVEDILSTGTQIILGNTYHLFLRPGLKILEKFGGLQKFMNWEKPILTDSGGFQVMSLSKFNKIDEKKGAIFSSHIDGKKFILSPEKSIQIQKIINSDILMVLDVCPKLTNDKKSILRSINISNIWAKRCKDEFNYEKNKEKVAERGIRYRANNKEKIAARKAQRRIERNAEQPNCTYQIKNVINNKVYIGESKVEVENLIPRLNAITEQNTEARIYIRGDRVVAYGRVMEIMSIINSAGYIKVALITQNLEQ